MSNHYFGGSSVLGGHIRRLGASNFKEFVERYVFVPIAFPMTSAEFWALPTDKDRDKRKDGPYAVACSYDFEEGHREDDTATSFHTVFLDLDEGDFVRDFIESPETIGEHLWPYSFVAYTTAKHNPKKGYYKLKIAIPVRPSHPSLHRRYVKFFADRLGIPADFKGARESGVLSQPQYRPIQFKGDKFTAVIASRLDGIEAHESDLPDELAELDEEINGRTYACDRGDADDDPMGLAYLPVPGITVEDLREPLFAIDPDVDYQRWYEVFAAFRHQFPEEAEAKGAYEMLVEWSSGGTKYQGRKDCWAKWKSFRPYAKGRAPITIRSLFKQAIDAGWSPLKVTVKLQQTINEWLATCEDREELMSATAAKIVAMPLLDDVVEESLVIAWQKAIKRLTGDSIDKTTLKKAINRVRKKEKAEKLDLIQSTVGLPGWLQTQTFLAVDDVFFDFADQVALKPGAFDRKFEKELMPREGSEIPANGKPIMSPSAYALNIMKIPRVDRKIYCPLHAGEDPFFELDGKLYLNTYDRNSIPVEDPEFAIRAGELFYQHCIYLVGEEHVDLLIDFLAAQVQYPGRKIPWAICIQSAEGVGKGLMGKIMARVLGVGNVKSITPEVIRSQWNDWMTAAAFFILEEVHFPGERREAIMNALKQFITDPVITINQRNTSARNEPSWSCVIAFTNFPDALHLKGPDRRWTFIRSKLQTKQHVLDLNATGHFDRVEWLLSDDGAGGLRYWLRKRKIAADFPFNGPAPHTKYRDAVVEESKPAMQVKIEDLIEDNRDPLVSAEVIHVGRLNELLNERGKEQLVSRYLTLMGYEKYGTKRYRIDESRGAIWVHTEKWLNGVPPEDFLKNRMGEKDLDFV